MTRRKFPAQIVAMAAVAILSAAGVVEADDEVEFEAVARAHPSEDPGKDARSRVTRADMEESLPKSAPDALKYEPGVSVQQTSHGQASPYIRGLTGQQVLLMFDGIRLNNGIFRQGPNQYFFTVDAQTLDHIDVVRGSSSTEFGSDAIGGAILATPIAALPAVPEEAFALKPRVSLRFASADMERGGRAENTFLLAKDTALRVGGGYRVSDELESGGIVRNEGKGIPYVPRFREDGRTQVGTGFREATFDVRVEHAIKRDLRVVGAVYGYRQMDAPRTDQCPPAEAPLGACTTFLHQDRTLAYTALRGNAGKAFRDVDLSLSWQGHYENFEFVPFQAAYRSDSENRVSTVGLVLHASTPDVKLGRTGKVHVRYGLDGYHDAVGSSQATTLTNFGITNVGTRGQYIDGSSYMNSGAFAELHGKFWEKLALRGGGRMAAVSAKADGDPASGTQMVNRDWYAFIGRAGASYAFTDAFTATLNYDQGFRAPNLDDLTARQPSGPGFQIENAQLRPERSHTGELGASLNLDWLTLDAWAFLMGIEDGIARGNRDVADCPPGAGACLAARNRTQLVNANDTTVLWGTEGGATVFAPYDFTLRATYSYAWGEQDTTGTQNASGMSSYGDRVPVSRVPPFHGTAELRWRHRASGVNLGAAWRWSLPQTRLAPSDLSDARIPEGGTPGYNVVDLRAGWHYDDKVRFALVFENMFDAAYRVHGSSINGPGRGVVLTATVSP